jgi:hypothetical protein
MNPPDRRAFLRTAAGAALIPAVRGSTTEAPARDLAVAPFRFDVTPPMGHSLCGGWIRPAEAVDDALEAIGVVLLGLEKPVVLCAVDWTGLLNEAHVAWRTALAEAAGTTPDRVAVQCVHQHNAPFACLESQKLIAEQGDLPAIVDLDFFRRCLDRGRDAVRAALQKARRVTHIAVGKAKVEGVAANRRVHRDKTGKVLAMRGSSCKDPKLRALPEGPIDPDLRTVAFFDKETKLAACHYYATHPMSYYGDGRVSSDFVGLARKQRQKEEPDCCHLYFTGCAGDVAAGKYNDGSKELRPVLTKRIYDGIVASEENLKPESVGEVRWRTQDVLPPPRAGVTAEQLATQIANKKNTTVNRNRPSYQLAWVRRTGAKAPPIVVSALHVNDVSLLHLPSESFIAYQLRAQELASGRFVATAAYGDGGPWYIPTKEEYPHGGYEVGVAFCDPAVDDQLTSAMRRVLSVSR